MPVVKVLRHGQITLPKEIRSILGLKEGDLLEVKLQDSTVFLQAKTLVDKETVLTSADQEKIQGALKDYREGRVKEFDNIDKLINELNS